MAVFSQNRIQQLLNQSDNAPNADAKGRIFEDLVEYLITKFRGIRLAERNVLDATGSQELDLLFWNNRLESFFDFLDPIIMCKCKNEADPLSSASVREFVHKLRTRGANSGILVSSSGISGQLNGFRHANSVIMDALSIDRIKVIVIDRDEIQSFTNTDDLFRNISDKYLRLTVRRTIQ